MTSATMTASGISSWLNRDPIGEEGGKNLYVFVFNQTNNFFDALGESGEITYPNGRVTGYTYVDNTPNYSDEAAWSGARHRLEGLIPVWWRTRPTSGKSGVKSYSPTEPGEKPAYFEKDVKYFRSDITAATYSNPSTMAISSAILNECPFGSKVLVDGLGWFLVEGFAGEGTQNKPRFDAWMALAERTEISTIDSAKGYCIKCYPPGSNPSSEDIQKGPSGKWNYLQWTSEERLQVYRNASDDFRKKIIATRNGKTWSWEGIYRDGALIN